MSETPTPTKSTPVQPPITSLPPKLGRKWLWWTLAIVIVVVIGAEIWWMKRPSTIVTPEIATPTNTTTPVTTNTNTTGTATDSTAGWETYTNTDYGFSFSYNNIYNLTTESADVWGSSLHLNLINPEDRDALADAAGTDQPPNLTVDVYKNIKELDSSNLGATSLVDFLEKSSVLSDPKYINITPYTLGNQSGYSADAGPNQFGGGKSYFVDLDNGITIKVWEFSAGSIDDIIGSFVFSE